jgi:hypothetical protein
VRSGRISFADWGRYCTHIHVDHKVALFSEESSMYMNFIDWIARTSAKRKRHITSAALVAEFGLGTPDHTLI